MFEFDEILHIAAGQDDALTFKRLVEEQCANKNAVVYGWTLFHRAAYDGRINIVMYFVENGNHVDEVDDNGWGPLHAAVSGGRLAVINYLTEQGANINKADKNGNTPLHIAASTGDIKIARKLVSLGGKLDSVNHTGKDPIMCAFECGRFHFCEEMRWLLNV
jgi:ankyrin repeat protein